VEEKIMELSTKTYRFEYYRTSDAPNKIIQKPSSLTIGEASIKFYDPKWDVEREVFIMHRFKNACDYPCYYAIFGYERRWNKKEDMKKKSVIVSTENEDLAIVRIIHADRTLVYANSM
jgi:hypothetical protein